MFSIPSTTTKCRSWYIVQFCGTRKGKSFDRHIEQSLFNCFGRNSSSFYSISSRHIVKTFDPPKERFAWKLNGDGNSVESIEVEVKKFLTRAGNYTELTHRNAENQERSNEAQFFPFIFVRKVLRVSQIFQTKNKKLIQPIANSWRKVAY